MADLRKYFLRLTPPSLKDNTASLDRLAKALAPQAGGRPLAPVDRLNQYAQAIKDAHYAVTATVRHGGGRLVLVAVEPDDVTATAPPEAWAERAAEIPGAMWGKEGLGVALDIGSLICRPSCTSWPEAKSWPPAPA